MLRTFLNEKLKSVETPKGFMLGGMGSLVFEPPTHFSTSVKRNI